MNKLLIATNNKGKVKELQDLLKDTGIELVTPAQIDLDLDVIEDGTTYAENAAKKAIAFARASGLISLADDSGLEVDALDGAPGLYSARYGSPDGGKLSDAGRRAFLIQTLQGKPRPWMARFHATIAIAVPSNVTLSHSPDPERSEGEGAAKGLEPWEETLQSLRSFTPPRRPSEGVTYQNESVYFAEGFCEGEIIPEERGSGGFGYDPIFLLPELGKTMAELSMDEKNRLSHRARAVINAKGIVGQLYKLK
jgi:XTP/dITP diphosphohydrolase